MANTTFTTTGGPGVVTLSGGNLTGQLTSGTAGVATSNAWRSHGKYYFEVKMNVLASVGIGAGLGDKLLASGLSASPDMVLTYTNQLSGGIYANGNNTNQNVGATLVANDVLCIAVDLDAALIWFRKNGGNWQNVGANNPATGVGGINLLTYWPPPSILNYGMAPALFFWGVNDQMTANFGDTAFAQAVPAGFTAGWPAVTGMANRVSTASIEVVTSSLPKNRVSTAYAEVVTSSIPKNRISQSYIEIVTSANQPKTRVSAIYAEILSGPDPNFGAAQARAMVLA